ncbi:hypothetical protein D3W54_16075 (plasmid) [Komagataeibacter medellinensis]|uniref:Prohead serine protease domain-containing protein n=1 Tax=Komagataeibacter medellinensis TaxID=1177712 RepID=A0ABQ6VR22_9PROT|nr:HK97 family phage prohead protease [Komagataeibacter medellinensis]KAB8122226.1 hypothetical protein D3W54_16075 [Komagataeibacter medellinensis]
METNFYTIKGFKERVSEKQDVTNAVITKDYEILSSENGSTFTITTDASDREYDSISADGLDITNYLKNPVVLWGHDASQLPIGKCVNIEQVQNGWQATVEFVPGDYPAIGDKAEAIRRSIKDGFLSAVSIGFIPLEWDFNEEGGLNITKSELTEFSIVSIPCNPQALVVQRTLNTEEQPLVPEQVEDEPLSDKEKQKALRKKRIALDLAVLGINYTK